MRNGRADIVSNERAADARYQRALRGMERDRVPVAHGRRVPRAAAPSLPPRRGLLGRVALAAPSDIAGGTDYYIGTRYLDYPGLVVFSWAEAIAATFFRGRGTHELCPQVTATRTLLRQGAEITDYIDDAGPAPCTGEPFAVRRLAIPKAPSRRPLPRRAGSVPPPTPAVVEPEPEVRAERAVLAAISGPRQAQLTSVLATLQPDQYELVTADPGRSLVVQGHPGTGKTVIAAHRAAYLVHDQNERSLASVLVVGPTEHYIHHISAVVDELVERVGAVEAMSLDAVMLDVRGVSVEVDDGQPTQFQDVDDELGQLAERAVHLLRGQGRLGSRIAHASAVEAAFEALRHNRVGGRAVTEHSEWVRYLRALPTFRVASRRRRHLPLLAACGAAVAGVGPYTYEHVIVDEAQDVTPLEWAVLKEINPGGSWTLLGDLNQRRSDLSGRDWSQIAEVLGEDAFATRTLQRGYRTSAAIMHYASRLLPARERILESLQTGGIPPRVEKVHAKRLYDRVAGEVVSMLDRTSVGTVAVIDVAPTETVRALRRAGFTVDGRATDTMTMAGRRVRVLHPQQARGLEFDAVVVVEPGAFPARLGRHGLLYTSLTRGNRELVVVHSEPLPDALRRVPPRSSPPIPAQREPHAPAVRGAGC